jgi:adenylate cyclase
MVKRAGYGLLVGLSAAVIALALWLGGALDTWENTTWMWRVRALAHPTASTPKIKLILLDQPSLDWGKKENQWAWPWPREVSAAILNFCHRGGAKAVAFDVLYTEPSFYGVGDDQAFGQAIKQGAPFAAAVFASGANSEARTWPEGPMPKPPDIQGLEAWRNRNAKVWQPEGSATFPISDVRSNAALLGNVASEPDGDGFYRHNAWFKVFDGRVLPTLGLAAYLADRERTGNPAQLSIEPGWLHVDDARLPIDHRGRSVLRFVGPSGTHQAFSAAAILQSELRLQEGGQPTIDPAVLKDCYVFFGYSAPGLYDLQPTPAGEKYPGVEIHATMLDNLLERSFLREAPRSVVTLLVVLLTVLAGIAGTLSRRAWQSVLGFAVFLAIPFGLGFAAYTRGFWWPVMVGEVGVGLSLVGAVVVNYATEGRQKAFLKSAFRHYLGAEVIEQIIEDPSRLKLGGEKRELTIFFSDIEKFSSFSERLDPPTLTALLNDYLSDMSAIIQAEGGYLDKYIGDAIVAFWNAPLDQADHAVRACRAAVRCSRKLAERRPEFEQRTGAVVKARIGMNTGAVAVGNMGSYERFNYTILGDAANLASRLEGANKAFGTYAMVSETTWEASGGQFVGRELGRLRVVGRKAPVRVYELAGLPGEPRPVYFAPFEEALALFYVGRFSEALARFEALAEDPASKSYTAQCRLLMEHPPVEWDGVLILTEK